MDSRLPRFVRIANLLLLSAMLGACVSDGGERVSLLERDVYQLSKTVKDLSANNQSSTLGTLTERVDLLEKEVSTLRGELEEYRHKTKLKLEELSAVAPVAPPAVPPAGSEGLSAALAAEGAGGATPALAATTPAVAASPAPEATVPTVAPPASPQAAYDQALQFLRAGQYDQAAAGFEQFVKAYPNHDLTDNSQYWIGEVNYVQRRYPDALTAFNQVLVRWPTSDKVPASLLKIGFAFHELGDTANARLSLERLIKDYPNSPTVVMAKQRLKLIAEGGAPAQQPPR